MLPTTSRWMRHLTILVEATAGVSRHNYRHKIRLKVGLGVLTWIHIRPTLHLSSSHILAFRQWHPLFSRACCRVLHVTCIPVHPHAPACIHVHLHASAYISLMPTASSPDFRFSEIKFFRVPRAFRAACIACRVHHVPRDAPKYIRVHLRASTCIHTHPRRSCVRRKHEIENHLNISDYM